MRNEESKGARGPAPTGFSNTPDREALSTLHIATDDGMGGSLAQGLGIRDGGGGGGRAARLRPASIDLQRPQSATAQEPAGRCLVRGAVGPPVMQHQTNIGDQPQPAD